MRIFLAIILFLFLCEIVQGAERYRVSVRIVCSDPVSKNALERKVHKLLADKNVPIAKSGELAVAELFIYANQDVDDRINPYGWSFAIAHLTNWRLIRLLHFTLNENTVLSDATKRNFVRVMQEYGILKHLNVAHVDKFEDELVDLLLDRLVKAFVMRLSTYSQ